MVRYRFFDPQIQPTIEPIALDERIQMALRPRRVRALGAQLLATPDREARARRIDGDAEAAEATSELAVEVDESQMQSRRNRDGHAGDGRIGVCVARQGRPDYHGLVNAVSPLRCQAQSRLRVRGRTSSP